MPTLQGPLDLLTELVPRICRLGFSDSSSFATILRKLSTKRLMLWQWQAMSSWSSASMAMHTYLGKAAPPPCHHSASCWVLSTHHKVLSLITQSPASHVWDNLDGSAVTTWQHPRFPRLDSCSIRGPLQPSTEEQNEAELQRSLEMNSSSPLLYTWRIWGQTRYTVSRGNLSRKESKQTLITFIYNSTFRSSKKQDWTFCYLPAL